MNTRNDLDTLISNDKTPKPQKTSLDFRPLTPGLGFHPLPEQRKTTQVPITSSQVTSNVSVQRPTPPLLSPATLASPTTLRRPQLFEPKTTVSKPVMSSLAQTPAVTIKQSRFTFLASRVAAYFLDSSLNISLCAGGLSVALIRFQLNANALFGSETIAYTLLFLIFFNWILMLAQEVAFGTTLGKRVFGLTLKHNDGTPLKPSSSAALFLRAFFFIPSLLFFGLGILWSLFDKKFRCWHDLVADVSPQR